MVMENPLKSLRIKNYYSYLLSLGGFLLIISLLYEPKVIPQLKLILLCIITIFYGLIEWIRESQFNDNLRQLSVEWDCFWEEESRKKGIAEINDPNWEANLRKRFKKEHNWDNLIPRYHLKTWVLFIIYLLVMIGAFHFI